LVDPSPLISPEPLERFDIIMNELSAYSSDLAGRPVIAVITKLDLPENHAPAEELRLALAERGLPVYKISAATGEGLPELLKTVAKTLRSIRLHTT
jgi:GTP-binding protein